jgi:hypothetical protein
MSRDSIPLLVFGVYVACLLTALTLGVLWETFG